MTSHSRPPLFTSLSWPPLFISLSWPPLFSTLAWPPLFTSLSWPPLFTSLPGLHYLPLFPGHYHLPLFPGLHVSTYLSLPSYCVTWVFWLLWWPSSFDLHSWPTYCDFAFPDLFVLTYIFPGLHIVTYVSWPSRNEMTAWPCLLDLQVVIFILDLQIVISILLDLHAVTSPFLASFLPSPDHKGHSFFCISKEKPRIRGWEKICAQWRETHTWHWEDPEGLSHWICVLFAWESVHIYIYIYTYIHPVYTHTWSCGLCNTNSGGGGVLR